MKNLQTVSAHLTLHGALISSRAHIHRLLCKVKFMGSCRERVLLISDFRLTFCLLFCTGVKLGLWLWGRSVGWGCLRIGCWGEYLGLRGKRWQGNGEKLRNEELSDLYSSPNIARVIKSRRMRYAGRMGERRRIQGFGGETWGKETTWEAQA